MEYDAASILLAHLSCSRRLQQNQLILCIIVPCLKKQNESKNAKQERLILDIMSSLSDEHPNFYYLSTIEVAVEIEKYIAEPGHLSVEQKQLLSGLDRHAIQMLLSLHSNQAHFKE